MADPVTVSLGTLIGVGKELFGLAKNKRTPNVVEVAKRTGDWNDLATLEDLERDLTGPRSGKRPPGAQRVVDIGRERLRQQVAERIKQLQPGPGEEVTPEPEPELEEEEELPEEELEEEELPGDDEYTDDDEAYDEYLSDLEAESGFWDQPWFEQADPVNDPAEQVGDPERRKVERELRKQDVAPYAVEYYRSKFVDDRPRVPTRVPTRVPGRVGTSGAMVEGIVGLIRLGRALWELQTEEVQTAPKGPSSRPRGRTRTRTEPELEPIRVTKARKPAVRLDETTRRALETRTKTLPEPELELEEIKVSKQRRAPAPPARPKAGTRAIVDLRSLGLLYDLVRDKPKQRTLVRERIITRPGEPELPPTVPELVTPPTTRSPELPPQQERARVEQSLSQDQGSTTRTREKKCKCEKPKKKKRTVCYEGFFREREKSEKRTRWNRVDCITGKDI